MELKPNYISGKLFYAFEKQAKNSGKFITLVIQGNTVVKTYKLRTRFQKMTYVGGKLQSVVAYHFWRRQWVLYKKKNENNESYQTEN